ncbi:histidine kinase [Actinotignum sanguinis]|uniref:sensor histidine kinase n=1 Tax=Actinotignum sanguinis TaxID=1445614 RepID=UPI000F7DDFB6|nr:histidine kinase [Actinotignum sanguinis]MDY5148341.1 histidine kinase [Actinotignum sanguinis]
MIESVFNRSRFTTARSLLFIIGAVIFAGIDVTSTAFGFYNFNTSFLFFDIGLWLLFALAGSFRFCEVLLIASCITLNACNLVGGFAVFSFGVPTVLVSWLLRSWIMRAVTVMAIETSVSVAVSPTPQLQLYSSIVITLATLTVGLALRWQNNRRALAEERTKEAFEAVRQTRQELARQLHDTTAKDLAHIAILAQDIAIRHPDLSEELDKLVKVATSASRRIRPLILSMDTTATETPLSEVITQVTNMLRTRDITLEVNINGDIDTLTTRQQRRTAALAIRECASNILKYAPAGSEANLVIEVTTAPNLLALSLSNQIASQPQTSHMSSGYGLANLANRIRTEGGTIQSKAVDQQWITYITLPAHASVPLETTSTQTAIPKE